VLDLFAGSGALGLEALSRGAGAAVFVDSGRASARIIRANAETLGYQDRSQVLVMSVPRALKLLHKQDRSFDLVFMDPPYARDTRTLMPTVAEQGLLRAGGLLVLEHDKRTEPPEQDAGLARLMSKAYGDTRLSIYHMEKR